MIQMNLTTQQKQTHRHRKQQMVTKGERKCGEGIIRSLGFKKEKRRIYTNRSVANDRDRNLSEIWG